MRKGTELASCVPRMPQPIDRGDMDKGGWCLGGDRDSGISFLGARIEIQRGSDAVSSLDGPRPYCVTGSQSVGDEATEIALAVLVCMRSPESRELCSRRPKSMSRCCHSPTGMPYDETQPTLAQKRDGARENRAQHRRLGRLSGNSSRRA